MRICGLQKLAMVDYPGKLAATVFTGGCNLRCPFCHNALLVTELDRCTESHTVEEILRKYRPQVESYARALSRIFEKPVKGRYLYLVRLNRFVEV